MADLAKLSALGIDCRDLVWEILAQSPDCIKILGPSGELEYMNPNGLTAMEIDDFTIVAGRRLGDLWPEESSARLRKAIRQAASGEKDRFDAYCPTAKGSPRWWDVSVAPILNDRGETSHVLCISRDITAQRRQAHEMAAELTHKSRNHLATMSALARLTLGSGEAASALSERLLERLGNLTLVTELAVEHGAQVPLSRVVASALEGIGRERAVSLVPVADGSVDQETARAVAIVLGELASNAVAHGALAGGGDITVRVVADGETAQVFWRERLHDGPEYAPQPGTGLRLATRLSATLPEPFRYSWDDEGMTATLTVALT